LAERVFAERRAQSGVTRLPALALQLLF
jgi:hypothetical protein